MELSSGCAKRLIPIPPANNVGIIEQTIRLNGIGKMRETGCWLKFTSALAEEFQVDNFRLNHYPVEDFYKSQWQTRERSFWYLLYRWCVALFYLGSILACAIHQFDNARFFIYLTDWGFVLCTIATLYGAVLTTLWHFDRVDALEDSWGIKLFWILHWSALVLSIVISSMFWTLLLQVDPSIAGDPYNLLQHATNSIVMIIDHFVVRFPSRILHFIYPLGIGAVYCLFSIIYYFAGGTGAYGASNSIYPILDWGGSPLIACLSVLTAVLACFIFSFILFWLYKLRVYLCRTFSNTQKPHTIHY
ncbi:protein rolling stone-like [Episyrphus balteatus]|uniref:protein rolling stone-like n=1 Tax=Episyrphus balteatus TaxID=286459 RepID=UPI0024861E87|nr:protein rolling stone-like [Episyrphus balteatus]XP_055848528.1 protein rolling stone-like [Episyrphus balteatus]XP_055848529.1 protein rolling stone-like [Episyrphus balteatus]